MINYEEIAQKYIDEYKHEALIFFINDIRVHTHNELSYLTNIDLSVIVTYIVGMLCCKILR